MQVIIINDVQLLNIFLYLDQSNFLVQQNTINCVFVNDRNRVSSCSNDNARECLVYTIVEGPVSTNKLCNFSILQ